MRCVILLITIFSISFAKTGMYVSYDVAASWELDVAGYYTLDDDYDSGALTVGYETSPENNLAYGISYDIIGLDFGGDDDDQFLNIYGKYFYSISPTMSLFGTVGYNLPQGSLDEWDGGFSYGIGLSMSNGVGVSYSFNNASDEMYGETIEQVTSRLSVSYSF